jgi:hypothetical protein
LRQLGTGEACEIIDENLFKQTRISKVEIGYQKVIKTENIYVGFELRIPLFQEIK